MDLNHLLIDNEGLMRGSQFDFAVESLEKLIFEGSIKPGEKLPSERELVQLLAVSRSVLREALRVLESRGIITILQGKGVYVRKPGMQTVIEPVRRLLQDGSITLGSLMQARCLIEPQIARLACLNMREEHIAILEKECSEMKKCHNYTERFLESDKRFHSQLAISTGNPVLAIMLWPIVTLLPGFTMLIYPGATDQIGADHDTILLALKERDPDAAEKAMKKHLAKVIEIFKNSAEKELHLENS